ncbi:MAG: hypothetical protein HRU75_03355 [Planctomycetia bacterium]|nr:MAG: hypothetical protein HRU75_03355 [Planctomycetia bacterium]
MRLDREAVPSENAGEGGPSAAGSRFAGDAAYYFIVNGVMNVANYAFLLVAVRTLTKPEFGVFNALLALLTLSTVMMNSLLLHVARQVARIEPAERPGYWRASQVRLAGAAIAGGAAAAILTPAAWSVLGATAGEWGAMLVAAAALLFVSAVSGIATGLQRMRLHANANLAGALVKLAIGAALLAAGGGVSAALAAYGAGLLVSYALITRGMRSALGVVEHPSTEHDPDSVIPAPFHAVVRSREDARRPDALRPGFVAAYLGLVAPFCLDQVFVQALVRPLSGDYAALCTLAKIVFLCVGPLLLVMYSHVSSADSDAARRRRLLSGTLVAVLLIGGLLAGVLAVLAPWLTHLMLAPQYAHLAPLVGLLAAGTLLHAVAHTLGLYSLALGRWSGLLASGVIPVAQAAAIALAPANLTVLVAIQCGAFAAQVVFTGAAVLRGTGRAPE